MATFMARNYFSKKHLSTQLFSCLMTFVFLSACSTTNNDKLKYNPSYLLKGKSEQQNLPTEPLTNNEKVQSGINVVETIKPFYFKQKIVKVDTPIVDRFSENKKVKISADELPLNEFLHYVMGEVLQVSYILGENVKGDDDTLTLNLINSISHRKLYSLVEELLIERKYVIRFNDGIYYINQEQPRVASGEISYGYGNQVKDIPETTQEVWQIVPFNYAFNGALLQPLLRVAKVSTTPDVAQNAFLLKGKRNEVIKAVEFIRLFDKPGAGKKHIAMYTLEFSNTESIITKLTELLTQEGISLGSGMSIEKALSIVALDNINTLTFFANSADVIKRALLWVKKIDQPEQGEDIQYFIYPPQFSRATDLGESLKALISGGSIESTTSAKQQNQRSTGSQKNISAGNSEVKLVVDERANSLIFQTTGDEYRKLLPLIKRLDVMPKQILLEVVIAEVQLTDEFQQGVSFSLTNQSTAVQRGGFTLESGKAGLTYALTGLDGSFDLNLFQTNSHVDILSRPSLLVRDGASASFNVGKKIPTVGEIITDPTNGSRTSVIYLDTGVKLDVTPTINAQGVIIMEVSQTNTDSVKGNGAVAGATTVFERGISTEVVAESGQTVILGGLISENRTRSDTSVPFFSSIPLLGKLFDSESDNLTKSELVIMVTPRVVESNAEWRGIYQQLKQELKLLDIEGISTE